MSVLRKHPKKYVPFFNIDPEKGTKCMVLERVRGNKEYPFCLLHLLFQSEYTTDR
mgnify:CR=1 FL=1